MGQHRPPHDPSPVDAQDPIARVLKLGGARPQPDPERKVEFKKALRTEWYRVTESRSQYRAFGWTAAIASGIAVALVLAWLQPWRVTQQPVAIPVVGHVVRTEGTVGVVRATVPSRDLRHAAVGDEVRAGTVFETAGDGRMALALDGRTSLRIDADSRIAMVAERTVRLERGAVYVDSQAGMSRSVLVQTANGDVRDLGTQFEVRGDRASLRVRVREGEVLVSRRESEMTARAGEALHVDPEGRYRRSAIRTSGPDWAWTSVIAPPFQLEGSTVRQFLDWVAREQGWRWRFADAGTDSRAAGIVTHGSLEGYTPEAALAIVLPTCGLSFVRNEDEIVVSFVKEPSPRGQ